MFIGCDQGFFSQSCDVIFWALLSQKKEKLVRFPKKKSQFVYLKLKKMLVTIVSSVVT